MLVVAATIKGTAPVTIPTVNHDQVVAQMIEVGRMAMMMMTMNRQIARIRRKKSKT